MALEIVDNRAIVLCLENIWIFPSNSDMKLEVHYPQIADRLPRLFFTIGTTRHVMRMILSMVSSTLPTTILSLGYVKARPLRKQIAFGVLFVHLMPVSSLTWAPPVRSRWQSLLWQKAFPIAFLLSVSPVSDKPSSVFSTTYTHLSILVILIVHYVYCFRDIAENDIAVTVVCLYTVSKAYISINDMRNVHAIGQGARGHRVASRIQLRRGKGERDQVAPKHL